MIRLSHDDVVEHFYFKELACTDKGRPTAAKPGSIADLQSQLEAPY